MARRRRRRQYHCSGSGGTLTGDPTTGSVVPPRQPSFQYFRFGSCPPATIAKTTTHSLCFAVPGPGPGPLGLSRAGTHGVSNSNVPAAAAVVLDGHRHDMSKYLLGRGDDNGGAVAKRKDDVQFFDFLGVGI
jgi:myb proto-oncogene protein